ncbi:MAG TPA: MobQ family relaxase [Ktedonobacteraceae bacterium]|nr:MobQ family relaxase [Ktedonobacteraceae bacterium]
MTTTASWYHCSVKPISRSSGRTAVAAAAYRSGECLHDKQLHKTYDYTRRRGVEASFIVAPEKAPEWVYNLQELWNQAQQKDNRANSRMAREVELALPNSLTPAAREALTREFALHLVAKYGVAVSVALHKPSRNGDQRNHHAHILMSTRRIDENGFGAKTRELDDQKTGPMEVEYIREYASMLINEYLEDLGSDERVDHRSFKDRGMTQEPTKHLGVEASAMERRGEQSELGNQNREIQAHNAEIEELVSDLAAIDAEIARETQAAFLPQEQEMDYGVAELSAEEGMFQIEAMSNPLNLPTSVLDEISGIRDIFNSVTAKEEAEQEVLLPPPAEEEEQVSFDLFASPIVRAFEADIRERGEITERGIRKSWIARTVTIFENFYYGTIDYIKTAIHRLVGGNEDVERPDIETDLDDYEPDR